MKKKKVLQYCAAMVIDLQGVNIFVKLHIPIMKIRNKLHQTRQSMMVLLEHVIPHMDMLTLGYLSTSIVITGQLKDVLLKIQT